MTSELRRWAEGLARRLSRGIEYSGGRADAAYITDLVQDVFADVWLGKLKWNPKRSLKSRVRFAIRKRIWRKWEHVCKFPHLAVEERVDALAAELERQLVEAAPVSNPERARFIIEVVAWIRKKAADDRRSGSSSFLFNIYGARSERRGDCARSRAARAGRVSGRHGTAARRRNLRRRGAHRRRGREAAPGWTQPAL
jgi:hypothetical protein